jgi:uncharacterized glyoxalase superfamily protein PhnB
MRPNIFPVLRYRDGHAAIDWLTRVFGFERHAVHDAPDGSVVHAELRWGASAIALGSAPPTPDNPWSHLRQSLYITVKDVDALHDRARAAGAEIASPLKDQPYGSREFGVCDPEGHLWGFGTYDMAAADGTPNLFPGLYYVDSRAALVWLERTFGFRKTFEVPGPDGSPMHAEMRFGDGAVFLDSGPKDQAAWGDNAQAAFVYLTDPDAHHARAKAAGADILQPPKDVPWGRSYYVRDLDGFLWGFSTYMPR